MFLVWQPYVDFGLKLLGGDLMAIPGVYGFVQVLNLSSCPWDFRSSSFRKEVHAQSDFSG
jgi:hypothetical protein